MVGGCTPCVRSWYCHDGHWSGGCRDAIVYRVPVSGAAGRPEVAACRGFEVAECGFACGFASGFACGGAAPPAPPAADGDDHQPQQEEAKGDAEADVEEAPQRPAACFTCRTAGTLMITAVMHMSRSVMCIC